MKLMRLLLAIATVLFLIGFLGAQNYVGSDACSTCHGSLDLSNAGYNIFEEYMKTGHPFKLNEVNGGPPTYPANTSPGVPDTPPRTTWNDFSYVIGGYGWKARFVKTDGFIFTEDDSAQYNLFGSGETQWVPYHLGEIKPYDYGCFQCHTTGPDPEGSWNGVPTDSLGVFAEPGIRCEGCHGPASDHLANQSTPPPIQADSLAFDRCGDCHTRGSKTNVIPASGGFIRHHEQYNEMKASKHGDGVGPDLTCASCHNPHIAVHYEDVAGNDFQGNPLKGIKVDCETCHPNHEITFQNGTPHAADCEDCHMPKASKSALGFQLGNGWEGDVHTHIWLIDTRAVTKDSMFTLDGSAVQLDGEGHAHVTLDFVCLKCHQDKDVTWAAGFAEDIHTNGLTEIGDMAAVPENYVLLQNYPNPFNPETTIEYQLPKTTRVRLVVYNALGQQVAVLANGLMAPGSHKVTFQAQNLPSGIYVYRLETEGRSLAKKMVLMK